MRVDSRCPLCNHPHPTVQHTLSACPTALQRGRYTWRHDSALKFLVDGIKSGLPEARVLADLPGFRAEENPVSTTPNEILVTTARPDIEAITNRTITLVEITIPYNSPECLTNAKHNKETKTNHQLALSDLDFRGYSARLITIEIGALGHWLPSTRASLHQLLPDMPSRLSPAFSTRLQQQPLQAHTSSSMPDKMMCGTHPAQSYNSL